MQGKPFKIWKRERIENVSIFVIANAWLRVASLQKLSQRGSLLLMDKILHALVGGVPFYSWGFIQPSELVQAFFSQRHR